MNVNNALGWAATFFILIAMTDIPATASIAAAFALLFFIAILMKYGEAAFNNLNAINKQSPVTAGGGGKRKQ